MKGLGIENSGQGFAWVSMARDRTEKIQGTGRARENGGKDTHRERYRCESLNIGPSMRSLVSFMKIYLPAFIFN